MFIGFYNATIDAKGRIKFPARLCSQIQDNGEQSLIMALHPDDPCLVLYPFSDWEKMRQKVSKLPSFHPRTKKISKRLIQLAVECELNSTQRILIPSALRKRIILNKSICISAGAGQYFEIWDEQVWDKNLASLESLSQNTPIPTVIEEFSL